MYVFSKSDAYTYIVHLTTYHVFEMLSYTNLWYILKKSDLIYFSTAITTLAPEDSVLDYGALGNFSLSGFEMVSNPIRPSILKWYPIYQSIHSSILKWYPIHHCIHPFILKWYTFHPATHPLIVPISIICTKKFLVKCMFLVSPKMISNRYVDSFAPYMTPLHDVYKNNVEYIFSFNSCLSLSPLTNHQIFNYAGFDQFHI